ncbi:uncharacterized protein LOC142358697 [Convolutriloba macropyga]|uniref:uncharacterized protein LOC142358697 n=1 Tax=Convolutriloba macropyga TaxID=536237 RepID=UPI003F51AFA4
MVERTTNFTGELYKVGMLWSEPERNLPNSCSLALGQIHSLERRFQRDPNFGKNWYLLHHSVLNPNEPGKVRRVCDAASKLKEVCISEKLLARPDLLHVLIETAFRCREGLIALAADIEAMFLQVQIPEQDRSCLRFLRRPITNELVQIYEHQRHVFGAMSSSTCAKYALKRVGIYNEGMYQTAAKPIQNNYYMDDFIKSVDTPEGVIEPFSQLRHLLSNQKLELKKAFKAIPADLKSISNKNYVEIEPNFEGPSVLGLQ